MLNATTFMSVSHFLLSIADFSNSITMTNVATTLTVKFSEALAKSNNMLELIKVSGWMLFRNCTFKMLIIEV